MKLISRQHTFFSGSYVRSKKCSSKQAYADRSDEKIVWEKGRLISFYSHNFQCAGVRIFAIVLLVCSEFSLVCYIIFYICLIVISSFTESNLLHFFYLWALNISFNCIIFLNNYFNVKTQIYFNILIKSYLEILILHFLYFVAPLK